MATKEDVFAALKSDDNAAALRELGFSIGLAYRLVYLYSNSVNDETEDDFLEVVADLRNKGACNVDNVEFLLRLQIGLDD